LLRAHRTAGRLKRATAGLTPVNGDGAPPARERRAPVRLQEQIVRLRKERGISQRQLSERVGMEQPRIARIEAGAVHDLELRTVSRLADALGARVKIVLEKRETTRRRA
jgi:ribosome-binding protein aMBF1 (putative translation factor)